MDLALNNGGNVGERALEVLAAPTTFSLEIIVEHVVVVVGVGVVRPWPYFDPLQPLGTTP